MTLGERIVYRRESLGLRQIDLAERVGVTNAAINQYESGVRVPNAYTFRDIAKVLGCTMDQLMNEDVKSKEARA